MKYFITAIIALCLAYSANAQVYPRSTIESWFYRGAQPTAEQFHNWQESYWHKQDVIPIGSISGLGNYMTYVLLKDDSLFGVTTDTTFLIGVIDNGNLLIDSSKIKYSLDAITGTPPADAISGNKYLILNPPHYLDVTLPNDSINPFYVHANNIATNIGGTYSFDVADTGDIATIANPTTSFYKYHGAYWQFLRRSASIGGDSINAIVDVGSLSDTAMGLVAGGKRWVRVSRHGNLFFYRFKNHIPKNNLLKIDSASGELTFDTSRDLVLVPPLYWADSEHTILGLDTTGLGGGTGGSSSLAGLSDVSITSVANGQLLKYNSTSHKWENFTPTYISSYTETDPQFNTKFSGKTTDDLAQGSTNLYNQTHTGDATGATALTVVGIRTKSIPSLSSGFLKYNGSAWVFDNSTYLTSYTETDPLALKIASNLSDLNNTATARINLGLGSFAVLSNPATTNKDFIYYDGSAYQRLAKGNNGQHLIINGSGNYAWVDSSVVSGGISGAGSAQRVAIWNGASSLTNKDSLFYDTTNYRLGLGSVAPTHTLTVKGNGVFYGQNGTSINTALSIVDTVTATSTVNQNSGRLSLIGTGWENTAPAPLSIPVGFGAYILPVTTVPFQPPYPILNWQSYVNGTYTTRLAFTDKYSRGTIDFPNDNGSNATPLISANSSSSGLYSRGGGIWGLEVSGTPSVELTAGGVVTSAANYYSWSSGTVGNTGGDLYLIRSAAGIVSISNDGTLNATGSLSGNGIVLGQTTFVAGDQFGIYGAGLGAFSGNITYSSGSNTLTGSGTNFLKAFRIGDSIVTGLGQRQKIATIVDATNATIVGTWSAGSGGVTTYYNKTLNGQKLFSVYRNGTPIITEPIATEAGTPTISAGTGAGTSPTVSITGNDISGYVTITTGSSPTASGDIVTISFSIPIMNTPTSIQLTQCSDAAGVEYNKFFVDQSTESSTSWKIKNTSAGALTAATTYKFHYTITQ